MLSVVSPLPGQSPHFRRRNRRVLPVSCSSVWEVEKPPADFDLRPGLRCSPQFPEIRAAKRVVLVRHGQSTWNEEGRIQGSSDHSVLTAKGESQAETSRQMLLGDFFDVCFTSPLIRSKRTAEVIWDSRKDNVITEPDLREIDLYSFQGLLKHEGKEKFGSAYRQWQKDAENFQIDGHYPVRELWDRAESCWSKILAHEGRSVLVVAHNAVNQALVATAIGLGTKYFRILLQSNCGLSVLDFVPRIGGGSPRISLNRLNQTPNSPVAHESSGGRKTNAQIILVCHGATQSNEAAFSDIGFEPLNMLGVIQSQKTAELLLDLKMSCLICSPRIASADTATAICEVQEAADCLGADCVPRYVEMKKMLELEVEPILQRALKISRKSNPIRVGWFDDLDDTSMVELWSQSRKAWHSLLQQLSNNSESEPESERNVVVVAHPAAHIALIAHCLKLTPEWTGSFHLDTGSISVIDFPDGPEGKGVLRCLNYTAHLGRWSIPVTRSPGNDEEF
ncbi:hypothetical protein KFK09_023141 [Dendrobium nobile]|uniref:2-carboxy-D-arabinitol-1-phosphatase n=1 Tax=Dendrobium nobile TaxID=94219 RepID=A0A8T3AKM7_DENNO|nr:hypothetical protein KFK09_023141 [Dendrobium nobile]